MGTGAVLRQEGEVLESRSHVPPLALTASQLKNYFLNATQFCGPRGFLLRCSSLSDEADINIRTVEAGRTSLVMYRDMPRTV